MKILIAYQYYSFKGGIEHVITSQAKSLYAKNHQVALLTSSYLGDNPKEIVAGVPILRVRSINYSYHKFGIPFAVPYPSFKNLRRIKAAVDDVDIVNIHGHPYLFSLVVTCFALRAHKPIILTQHNTKIHFSNRIINVIHAMTERSIGTFNLTHASSIVAVSDQTRRYVTSLVPHLEQKVSTVYNGIDATRFKPVSEKQKLREELGLPLDKFICFTVRRITFKNGIDTLLRTAQSSNDDNVVFLLGGTGPDLSATMQEIQEKNLSNIKLLGAISDEDLPKYYAASDVFILPSQEGEGFPMVVLEAFASGLPVVATKSGGHVEIIKDSENGYLVDVGQPSQINEKIRVLMKCDLVSMAARCRELTLMRFTWETNTEQLLGVITELEIDV